MPHKQHARIMHKRKREEDELRKKDVGDKLRAWKRRFEEEYNRPPRVDDLDDERFKYVKRLRVEFEDLKKTCAAPLLPDLSEEEINALHERYHTRVLRWEQWEQCFAEEYQREPTAEDLSKPAYQAAARLKEEVAELKAKTELYPKQKQTFSKSTKPATRPSAALVARATQGEYDGGCLEDEEQEAEAQVEGEEDTGAEVAEDEYAGEEVEEGACEEYEECEEDPNDVDVSNMKLEFTGETSFKLLDTKVGTTGGDTSQFKIDISKPLFGATQSDPKFSLNLDSAPAPVGGMFSVGGLSDGLKTEGASGAGMFSFAAK